MKVAYMNWWNDAGDLQDRYLSTYINNHIRKVIIVEPNENPDLLICSVFGPLSNIINCKANKKIFFYGENINRPFAPFTEYKNEDELQKIFDLIIGFKKTNKLKKIIRFPLWITYYGFDPKKIINHIETSYKKNIVNKTYFASLVARHDMGGQRSYLYKEMEKHGRVLCPSRLLHNVNVNNGNFNKIQFISKGIFNICPENSKEEGYCTEKIFQALEGGCIPLYWGADYPEKDILNENKYCFCRFDNPISLSNTISNAIKNKDAFINGPVFKNDAQTILEKYFSDLKEQLLILIEN